jgi:hypothetical protein
VLHDPAIFHQLLQYLTMPVSEMFRDPSFFLALRQQVVPRLAHLRVDQGLDRRLQHGRRGVFAGDPAARGRPAGTRLILMRPTSTPSRWTRRARGFSRSKAYAATPKTTSGRRQTRVFSDYYTAAYNAAVFDKSLRENITFADHSLATDSVFSETQLVLCRNVLIYFNKQPAEPRAGPVPRIPEPPRHPGPGQQGEHRLLRLRQPLRRAGPRRAHLPQKMSMHAAAPVADAAFARHEVEAVAIGASAGGVDALLRC